MMSGFIYAVLCCFTLLYPALLCFTLLYSAAPAALLCFTLLCSALLCFTLLHLLRRLYAEVIDDVGLHIRWHNVRIASVAA
jgi:hypothetical protein